MIGADFWILWQSSSYESSGTNTTMCERTTLTSIISPKAAGARLIDFLSSRFKYHSMEKWQELIQKGDVQVNGAPCPAGQVLKSKDRVSYRLVLREPPVDTGIRILHAEEQFLVAHKPGNLPSHANGNYIKHTFIYQIRKRMAEEGYRGYAALVHRLDRETSGVMIVAKTKDANRALARQFGAGDVGKEYIAVVRGVFPDDALEVNGPIAPDPASAVSIRRCVVPAGTPNAQSAVTRFELVERIGDYTVLRCRPVTGRTNQIRIHLAHIGHPLAGDKLYGRSDVEFLQFVQAARAGRFDPLPWMDAPRHMLHASVIRFKHPLTGKALSFQSPMPQDMTMFIRCRKPSRQEPDMV
jgi:RluA family pseudouridine synthase